MPIERLLRRPVQTLTPEATCVEAAQMMRDENVGAVVVARDGKPVGIVTDRDLAVRVVAAREDAEKLQLSSVMSDCPIYRHGDRSIAQVIATMREQAIRRIPIVDEAGALQGLVSLDDLVVLLAEQLAELAETVRAELGAGG